MGLPTVSFSFPAWQGLFAPSGTPTQVISKLNTALVDAVADPAVRTRLADLGADIFPREQQTPAALRALQKAGAENGGRSSRSWGSRPNEVAGGVGLRSRRGGAGTARLRPHVLCNAGGRPWPAHQHGAQLERIVVW